MSSETETANSDEVIVRRVWRGFCDGFLIGTTVAAISVILLWSVML